MTDTETSGPGHMADTEIDLYADFVENELEPVGSIASERLKNNSDFSLEFIGNR